MAARFKTKKHTFDGSWESIQSVFSAQDVTTDDNLGSFTVRAARSNAGDVFWADSDASEGGFCGPGEVMGMELDHKYVGSADVFFKSASGNVGYFTWLAP